MPHDDHERMYYNVISLNVYMIKARIFPYLTKSLLRTNEPVESCLKRLASTWLVGSVAVVRWLQVEQI